MQESAGATSPIGSASRMRAAQSIIADLVDAGYLTRERVGRRNHYKIHRDLPLRHPIEEGNQVAELIRLVRRAPKRKTGKRSA